MMGITAIASGLILAIVQYYLGDNASYTWGAALGLLLSIANGFILGRWSSNG